MAVNPKDPRNIIVGANDANYGRAGGSGQGLGLYVTHDAGGTWTHSFLDIVSVTGRGGSGFDGADPAMAFGPDGTAYYVGLGHGPTASGILVSRSFDGGTTWEQPKLAFRDFRDADGTGWGASKEYIAIDPSTGVLAIAFTMFHDVADDPRCPFGWCSSPIYLIRSSDRGQTWTAPTLVSPDQDHSALGAVPRFGPTGTLYVAYAEDTEPRAGCPGIRPLFRGRLGGSAMAVARSDDGGNTWRYHRFESFCDNYPLSHELMFMQTNSDPTFDVDPVTGWAYVAWSNRDAPTSTIRLSRSTDGGTSWSEPISIGDLGRSAFLPWLVARDRTVRLVYASILPGGMFFNAHYRESLDGGDTWSPTLQLDAELNCGTCPRDPDPENQYNYFGHLGDYWNIDARCGLIAPVWIDYGDDSPNPNVYTRIGTYDATGEAGCSS